MKLTAIILFNVLFLASADEGAENLTSSPKPTVAADGESTNSHQKTMRQCCRCPYLPLSELYLSCRSNSSSQVNTNQTESAEIECFAQKVLKNGTIDKEMVVKSLRHAYLWDKQVKHAVANCEYISNGTLVENLAMFYDCLKEFFVDDCVDFFPYADCIPAQDRFLRNKFVYENCTHWPKEFENPVTCCDTQTVYSENFNCEQKCRKTEFLHSEKRHCQEKCALEENGIVTPDGKIDFVAVKKVLLEKTKNTIAEHDLVDGVVDECENALNGTQATAVGLELCLRQKFTAKCVKFEISYQCGLIKNFMAQCPSVKPTF